MQPPPQSSASGSEDEAPKNQVDATSPESALENSRRELARAYEELEQCNKALRDRETTLSELREEIDRLRAGNPLSEKEAALEKVTTDLERAREMATMGS